MFCNGLITDDEMNIHPMSYLLNCYMGGDHADETTVFRIGEGYLDWPFASTSPSVI